ncbi:MAG: hypothetical protein M0P51_17410, partial [Methanoculleus sp.]|nr:hypothetical protein [Methanoculleus sp.]
MRKLILFISILFVSTIMYGQTDVVRNYTKPYFVKNVKVNDTLGTKRLIVTYGADTDKILRSDSVGLATWVTATSIVPADTFYFNYCNGCAGVVGWKHIGDTIYADTSVIGTKYDIDSLGATVWRLTGNNILGTEFIGTLNNIPLIFKVNNIQSGKITPNTFGTTLFGYKAGNTSITGDGNTYIGTSAGENTTTGNLNTFIGNFSGQNTTVGYDNTFVGYNSGQQNTGMGNTFLGSNAGKTTITGSRNIAIGYNAEFVTTNSVDSLNIGNTIYGNMFTKNTTVKGNLTADTLGSYNQCIPKAYIHQIIGCSPVDFPTGITVSNIGTSSNYVDTAYISKAYITDMSVSTVDMELVTTPDTIVCWEGDSLKYSLVSDITGITMYNQIGDYTARSDSGYFDYINVNTMVANNTLDINSLEIHPTIGTPTDRSPAGHFDSLYVYDTASLKDVTIENSLVLTNGAGEGKVLTSDANGVAN